MTDPHGRGSDPDSALAEAIQNPFSERLLDWYEVLLEQFPLWSFHRWYFEALHDSALPTTYPLPRFVTSIHKDEGTPQPPEPLDPLYAELDRLRSRFSDLTSGVADSFLYNPLHYMEDVNPPQSTFQPRRVTDLAYYEPVSHVSEGGYISPYEELGRELVERVEDLRFAPGTAERRTAQSNLDSMLRRIMATLAPHRAADLPPDNILRPIAQQGVALVELCWRHLPLETQEGVAEELIQRGSSEAEVPIWHVSYVLPVFSIPEIKALQAAASEAARWTRGQGPRPTPRRFVVWLMSHRLDAQATSIARVVFGTHAVEYFRNRADPIKPFQADTSSQRTPDTN